MLRLAIRLLPILALACADPDPPVGSADDPDAICPPTGSYDLPCEIVTDCTQNKPVGGCSSCTIEAHILGATDVKVVPGNCCAIRSAWVTWGAPDASPGTGPVCCAQAWVDHTCP